MPIQDKLKTNPELININNLIGDALDKLIERSWGSVTIVASCQEGRITTFKVNFEETYRFGANKPRE